MTQMIVTIEDNSPVALIKKAISLLRGVSKVVVQNIPDTNSSEDREMSNIPEEIKSLIGIASNISEDDITSDERLAYILSK